MLKIPISFKEKEKAIYDFIKSKRNYSDYIKDLVEADMKNKEIVRKIPSSNNIQINNNSMEIDI